MTDFLLCVLIGTVAQGLNILTGMLRQDAKIERHAVGILMFEGVVLGSLLYGLIRLAVWIKDNFGPALF